VIDEKGEQAGVMPLADALARAEEHSLDLVEIAPNAKPPVVRIMDYGKFKYEQEKQQQKQKKSKAGQVKEIRLTMKIGAHDLSYRVAQAQEFLNDNQKVKFNLMMKGRENANPRAAIERLKELIHSLEGVKMESDPVRAGRSISAVVTADKKTKPKDEQALEQSESEAASDPNDTQPS
jgi:translation initiation factor IF-3